MTHVRYQTTTRADGDFAAGAAGLDRRRAAFVAFDAPWTWLHQVHGPGVVTVTRPGEHAGVEADAAVTAVRSAPVAVTTADCVPVVLVGDGAVGVIHAGWRGLLAGVVSSAAEAMAALGHPAHRAVVGPHICGRCYEFGPAELDRVAARWGDRVRVTTALGTPGLDMLAGVRAALTEVGVDRVDGEGGCTACDPDHYWSHRARTEAGRVATVAWLEP